MNKIQFHSVIVVYVSTILEMVKDNDNRDDLEVVVLNKILCGTTLVSWETFLSYLKQVDVPIPKNFKAVNMDEVYILFDIMP